MPWTHGSGPANMSRARSVKGAGGPAQTQHPLQISSDLSCIMRLGPGPILRNRCPGSLQLSLPSWLRTPSCLNLALEG